MGVTSTEQAIPTDQYAIVRTGTLASTAAACLAGHRKV